MRNILLGTLGGLAMGMLSMFAYDHYFGEGAKLAQAETELGNAHNSLAQDTQGTQQLKSEVDAMSGQVQQLTAHNEELKKQLNELKSSQGTTASTPNPFAGLIKTRMASRFQQKLLLLKTRLNLTPEQEAAVKAAMDEEEKRIEEMSGKIFQGGKIDPQALVKSMNDPTGQKSVDQVLKDILTPDQKVAYQQMQDDQKKSQAETSATFEMNQMAPALQLSEPQKDQVYAALYQLRVSPPKPDSGDASSDPASIIDAQTKAKEDAMAKILTPDQLATYHQQAQSELEMQKELMQNNHAGAVSVAPTASH